ncbi:type III secretion system protein PrgH/EprH [Cupriavidus sp. YR651]|nr:type III secretion system protein PrgH/EprH [Cupriavidus sp. YR651]
MRDGKVNVEKRSMEELDSAGTSGDGTGNVVIRLLSGSLKGCEYILLPGVTLFIQRQESDLAQSSGMVDLPPNTIVIPTDRDGVNFEIELGAASDDAVVVRTLGESTRAWQIPFHTIGEVGPLRFCIKPAGADWRPGLLGAATSDSGRAVRRSSMTPIACMIAILATLAVLIWMWGDVRGEDEVADIATLIAGDPDNYQIVPVEGSTVVHVFSKTDRNASWARQAVARHALSQQVLVTTIHAEEMRIQALMQERYPDIAFHRIELADARRPVLMISEERTSLSAESRRALSGQLKAWMPYAQAPRIHAWKDAAIENQAAAGIDRLGLPYVRERTSNSVIFRVVGPLDDANRHRMQQLIADFQDNFGSRYIEFSTYLEDDWLKDKSYRFGSGGYVKVTPRHWLFPQTF